MHESLNQQQTDGNAETGSSDQTTPTSQDVPDEQKSEAGFSTETSQQNDEESEESWREKINQARAAQEFVTGDSSEPSDQSSGERTEQSENESSEADAQSETEQSESESSGEQQEQSESDGNRNPSYTPDPDNPMSPIGIIFGDIETVLRQIDDKYSNLSRNEINRLVDARDPEIMRYLILRNLLESESDHTGFLTESLESLKKEVGDLREALEQSNEDKRSKGTKNRGELTGSQAKLSTIAAIRGLKKVYLQNSGFYIVIRPFTLSELNAFYNTVDNDTNTLGYQLGGLMHVITDLFLKQKFLDLLPISVVSSNLNGWDDDNTLIENISLHDYETILWAMCSLMYKEEGVTIPMTCCSEDCTYQQSEVQVDLDKMKFNRKGVLTKEQKEFVMDDSPKSPDKVKEFRDQVEAFNKWVQYGDMQYHLQVPTLKEYLDCGNKLFGSITAYAEESHSTRDQKILNELLLHANKMHMAWVKEFVYGNPDEDGFRTKERDAIMESLDLDVHQDTTFLDDIQQFIRDSKISYFCYTSLECPVCGAKPTQGTVDEFTVLDMQYLFFDLTCRKLEGQAV